MKQWRKRVMQFFGKAAKVRITNTQAARCDDGTTGIFPVSELLLGNSPLLS